MKLCTLFSTVLGASSLAAALPSSSGQYFLRVAAPNTPWHNSYVVQLPNGLLGLQNFTTHPKIEPAFLKFDNHHDHTWSIRLQNQDSVAVIQDKESTATREGTVGSIGSTKCPSDKDCTTDKFLIASPKEMEIQGEVANDLYADNDALVGRLDFDGFKGQWQPVKDASTSEGWQLHFVGQQKDSADAAMIAGHSIKLDILPHELKVTAEGSTSATQRICTVYRFMCVCCGH